MTVIKYNRNNIIVMKWPVVVMPPRLMAMVVMRVAIIADRLMFVTVMHLKMHRNL